MGTNDSSTRGEDAPRSAQACVLAAKLQVELFKQRADKAAMGLAVLQGDGSAHRVAKENLMASL